MQTFKDLLYGNYFTNDLKKPKHFCIYKYRLLYPIGQILSMSSQVSIYTLSKRITILITFARSRLLYICQKWESNAAIKNKTETIRFLRKIVKSGYARKDALTRHSKKRAGQWPGHIEERVWLGLQYLKWVSTTNHQEQANIKVLRDSVPWLHQLRYGMVCRCLSKLKVLRLYFFSFSISSSSEGLTPSKMSTEAL